jgi:hypothetical protein
MRFGSLLGVSAPACPKLGKNIGLVVAVHFAARAGSARLPFMLFMVIERFKNGEIKAIGERFARDGRMLPPGVVYHVSWVDAVGGRCFQIMEADRAQMLQEWVSCWNDLVEFEIVPVVTSAEFWSKQRPE